MPTDPLIIRAAGYPLAAAHLEIEAAARVSAEGDTPPTFELEAYTGGPMRPDTDPPVPYPLVIDLATLRHRPQTPILYDHDFGQLVGQAHAHDNDGRRLLLRGVITGHPTDPDSPAAQVVTHARNGFIWPVSVRCGSQQADVELIAAGNRATVNNRVVTGPVLIVRQAELREVSFVPYAADPTATARIAAHGNPEEPHMPTFDQWLSARHLDRATLSAEALEALRADYDVEIKARNNPLPPAPPADPGDGNGDPPRRPRTLEEIRARQARRDQLESMAAGLADEDPSAIDDIEALRDQAAREDWPLDRFEATARRTLLHGRRIATDQRPARDALTEDVATAALCLSAGLPSPEKHFEERTLDTAARRFRHGLGIQELLFLAARQFGYAGSSPRDTAGILRIVAAGLQAGALNLRASMSSTLNLPGILSNTANKFLEVGFNSVDSAWRRVARIRPVTDFKAVTRHTLTGDYNAKLLPKGGRIEHAVPGEATYTNQAQTYARLAGIDRTDIINDDLNALSEIPRKLGIGCARALNRVFWTAFNAAWDTLFTTGNGNRVEAALSFDALTSAVVAFLNQTDPDGEPLGILPAVLLATPDVHPLAQRLYQSTELRDAGASSNYVTSNEHAGKYVPVVAPWFGSATVGGASGRACLLANPEELAAMEVVFLQGKQNPTIETEAADFTALGIQQRAYHDFGVATVEQRAGVAIEAGD